LARDSLPYLSRAAVLLFGRRPAMKNRRPPPSSDYEVLHANEGDQYVSPMKAPRSELDPLQVDAAEVEDYGSESGSRDQSDARASRTDEKSHNAAGLRELCNQFGYKLLVMLFVTQHCAKGFVMAFTMPCVSFIYKQYNVPGPQAQIFGGVTQLPWAMKPVIGLVSDAFPMYGFNKAPYISLTSLMGVMACATIAVVPKEHLSLTHLVMCLFLMSLQGSTSDLLTEAKYAEKMREKPAYGPALMTYVWFGLNAGGLVATAAVGPTLGHFGPRAPFLLSILPLSLVFVPLMKNFLEESPQSSEQQLEMRRKLLEQKEACGLCVLMFFGTVLMTFLGIQYESAWINASASLAVAAVMLVAFSIVLKPIIAKVNAFFLIQTSVGISINGAAFYFYTDTPEQFPEGPHFSQEFFTSVLGMLSAVCALVGVYTYQHHASMWTYRGLLMASNLALSFFSLSDLILFKRLNVRMGLPDTAFVMGASVLTSVIWQWQWMPGVVIMSQLCPHGMEATMYALLAGCHNLGNTVAANLGALVLEVLNCQPSGQANESAQFEHLWVASLISTVMPTLTLVLLPWLIPDAKQTDKILHDDDRDATQGSLLRRWLGA